MLPALAIIACIGADDKSSPTIPTLPRTVTQLHDGPAFLDEFQTPLFEPPSQLFLLAAHLGR